MARRCTCKCQSSFSRLETRPLDPPVAKHPQTQTRTDINDGSPNTKAPAEVYTPDRPNYTFISTLYTPFIMVCLGSVSLQRPATHLSAAVLERGVGRLFAGVWQIEAFIVVCLF